MNQYATLREAVQRSLNEYFEQLEGEPAVDLYQLVLDQIERPMLEIVLMRTKGNQSKAARWLGISRNTLRKLMEKYQFNV